MAGLNVPKVLSGYLRVGTQMVVVLDGKKYTRNLRYNHNGGYYIVINHKEYYVHDMEIG